METVNPGVIYFAQILYVFLCEQIDELFFCKCQLVKLRKQHLRVNYQCLTADNY